MHGFWQKHQSNFRFQKDEWNFLYLKKFKNSFLTFGLKYKIQIKILRCEFYYDIFIDNLLILSDFIVVLITES